MPYTPPSQRSPAPSKPNSPIISRNHSYSEGCPPHGAQPQKPGLPRSVSSTSYLNKHRQSPSITQNNTSANRQSSHGSAETGPSANGSLRPSSPVNNWLIPLGALTTPPDSSDDDDERGRDIGNLRELQEALQHIDVKRDRSPNRHGAADVQPKHDIVPSKEVQSLTAEARKISHSRSSSDIGLSRHATELVNHPILTSSSENSDVEDDELRIKPPLLRKKSGELVKPALRPASRRRPSSMPGTPTYSKAVHFNENMEQVRHFLQVDRPIAVSAGSSPVEMFGSEEYPFGYDDGYRATVPQYEMKLDNFPGESFERKTAPVRVERIFLASDKKTLVGTVAVANIAFHKLVVARFTLDYWKTTSEVVAEYNQDVRKKQASDGYDRFNFNIKLADQANLESKTLLLCVRYNVNGTEYWDNNNHKNYQVDFVKKTKQSLHGRNNHSMSSIPRSRQSPPAARPRSMPAGSFDDDFGHDFGSRFEFGSGRVTIRDSPSTSIRLRSKNRRGSFFPDQTARRTPTSQAFSTRYDFTASLSAALSTAQSAMGDRSGIKPKATESPVAVSSSPVLGTRPDGVSSDKPGLQSAEYNELIQKFCFFGTAGKDSPKGTPQTAQSQNKDGASDYLNGYGSSQSSSSSSPASPTMSLQTDGATDSFTPSRSQAHFSSRSTSPGPVTGSGPENIINSTFQYGYGMHGGIFPERSHTPQTCV